MGERKRVPNTHTARTPSRVIDDPKVKQLLDKKEAESGLETIIERIVEGILEKRKNGVLNSKKPTRYYDDISGKT